jgi:hypothetical protein
MSLLFGRVREMTGRQKIMLSVTVLESWVDACSLEWLGFKDNELNTVGKFFQIYFFGKAKT